MESAILRVVPNPEKRALISDTGDYHAFVRSLFFHRRKFMRSVLLSAFKGQLDKPQVDEMLETLRLTSDCRAEQLDIQQVLELFNLSRQKLCEPRTTEDSR